MFTGIIEETGVIKSVNFAKKGGCLTVGCAAVLENTKVGDSIAVNGICLTVTTLAEKSFTADVMNETLRRTSLQEVKTGSLVNLERALAIGDRLGGHLVSGHIDGVGRICGMEDNGIAVIFTIEAPEELTEGIIEKGSIAVEGISLTVISVTAREFSVSLIPHTVEETNLQEKKIGSSVNLETDMIGKYVRKSLFAKERREENLMALLAENGFL